MITLCEKQVWHYHQMGQPNERMLMEPLERGKTRMQWFNEKLGANLAQHYPWTGEEELKEFRAENPDEYHNLYSDFDYLHQHHTFKQSDETFYNRVWYVMITSSQQCYGGPEEGGWYYQREEFVKWCAVPSRQLALEIVAEYNMMKQPDYKPNWDALGDDDTVSSSYPEGYIPSSFVFRKDNYAEVCVLPCLQPQETPHYE